MKILRIIVGVMSFAFVWFFTAFFLGLGMAMLFPPGAPFVTGIGLDWRNLPGTVLGILAGLHSYRRATRDNHPRPPNSA